MIAGRALKGGGERTWTRTNLAYRTCYLVRELLYGCHQLGKREGQKEKRKKNEWNRNDQSAGGTIIILAIRGQKLWIIYFFRESRTKGTVGESDLESPGASRAFAELLQAAGGESFRGLCGQMGVWICIVLHTAYNMYHTPSLTLASFSLTL